MNFISHKLLATVLILYRPGHKFLVLIASVSSVGSGVQTCQSLHCLHTQSMDVDEGSDKKIDLDMSAWVFKEGFCAYAIIKISCAGLCIH